MQLQYPHVALTKPLSIFAYCERRTFYYFYKEANECTEEEVSNTNYSIGNCKDGNVFSNVLLRTFVTITKGMHLLSRGVIQTYFYTNE